MSNLFRGQVSYGRFGKQMCRNNRHSRGGSKVSPRLWIRRVQRNGSLEDEGNEAVFWL